MRLKRVTLKNIRSYRDASVDFTEGTTLLSGDIGSGKTTILLAVEFALFGIQRGTLSGGALLRHGEQHGSVTLEARIAGRDVAITRSIKRGPNAIVQEPGTLTIDATTTEYTAQELKARILELLNYPAALLTKGKGLLFRYTVYTPQEEMKAILFDRPDDRLDTLRKLFAMDTYKRARENAMLLVRDLRKEEEQLRRRLEELDAALPDERELKERHARLEQERDEAKKQLEQAAAARKERATALEHLEKERFEHEERRKRLAILETRIKEGERRAAELEETAETTKRRIEELAKNLTSEATDPDALAAERRKLDELQKAVDEKRRAIVARRAEHEAEAKRQEQLIAQVGKLAECPTCQQEVDEEHKRHIREEGERVIARRRGALKDLAATEEQLEERQRVVTKRREELEQKLRLVEANRVKKRQLDGLREDEGDLRKAVAQQRERVAKEKEERERVVKEQRPFDEEAYTERRRALEEARTREQQLAVTHAERAKDVEAATRELERAAKQRGERDATRKRQVAVARRVTWLSKQFINTAHAVEKALFMSVYGLFNEYFREWFGMLIEDETLTVRLDTSFTPVVVQNGYETELEHLSGGERTSVALAYRLALNRAINEFLESVQTRGLLVLDEPTDGFSSEQLDRVREVLDQLQLEQVIIVSHEAQMEGYVDHVIRVEKRGHVSQVSCRAGT